MGERLLDAVGIKRTLARLASEILDDNAGCEDLVVVGILRRGYPVAKRLAFTITQIEGETVPVGKLDVTGIGTMIRKKLLIPAIFRFRLRAKEWFWSTKSFLRVERFVRQWMRC